MGRDADGWVGIGDRGSVDEDGWLTVLGRGEAVVQTGGATVLVADVEAALRALPGVLDAVVVGVPHPALGAVVGAVVETGPDAPGLPGVRRASAAVLSPSQRPRRWMLVDALPRTPGGKVDRTAAAALLATAAVRAVPPSSGPPPVGP
jgi:acyl-coenzyme A synthetase/AMP-(fatty) acid ligase